MKRIYQITNYSSNRNPNGTLNGKMGCHIRLDVDSAAGELDEVKALDGTTETITDSLETHVASQAQRETGETLAAGDVEIFTMWGVDTSFLTMSLGSPTATGRALADDANTAAQRATLLLATMSQAEAEAGTATTTRAVTAQRIKQAINALGGGKVDLIQAQSGSGLSSMDYTSGLGAAYNRLILYFNIEPATDGADIEVVLSTDGGTSWAESAGSYAWVILGARAANTIRIGLDSATFIQVVDDVSNVAGEGASGTIVFHRAKSATARCAMEWQAGSFNTAIKLHTFQGSAKRLADEDITGIRMRASAGNITFESELYGVKDT